jgi:hypothetical protein
MSHIISYTTQCTECNTENRLPVTNQDIPREQVRENIFECGKCGARLGLITFRDRFQPIWDEFQKLGENNGEHRTSIESPQHLQS